jgi:hypothetical protein
MNKNILETTVTEIIENTINEGLKIGLEDEGGFIDTAKIARKIIKLVRKGGDKDVCSRNNKGS